MKSVLDTLEKLQKKYTRKVEVCSGVSYNSTYTTELDNSVMSNVLEVNGKGKLIAIIPVTTNSNYYGQIKVFTDNEKMVAGSCRYYTGNIYPFLIGPKFNDMIGYSRYQSNSYYTRMGVYLPMIDANVKYFDSYVVSLYSKDMSFHTLNSSTSPIVFDDSYGNSDGTFENNLKIMATQTGGTGYVDNYTKILVIYDLEE